MKWSFVLPGPPPSVNHMYTRTRRGIAKSADVEAYQISVSYIVKLARPKGWEWQGQQLRLYYDYALKREIDLDNAKKAMNDAIAAAINVNDKFFLCCDRSKVVNGKEKEPRVVVEIDDGHD